MPVWLTIDKHSGIPIYVQIVEQVKHALDVGTLRPGDPLPTVRQLAGDLTLANNTIVKAYDDLQRLGLIESRQGAGTVVIGNLNGALRREQVAAVLARLDGVVRDAAGLAVDLPTLATCFAAATAQFYRDQASEEQR